MRKPAGTVLGILAYESVARTLVGEAGFHGDDRVDEHLKSSASIWRHNDELRDKSRVAALILNFWGGDGPVWIDNTRLRGGSTPALATRPAGIPRELSELSQELKWYCSIVDTDKSLLPRARRIKRESVASYAGVRLRLGESRPDVEIVSETELIAVGDFDLRSACRIVINATNGSTTPAVVRLRISGGSAQKEVQTLGHYLPPNAGRVLEFDLCCASLRSEGTGWLPASGMPFRDKVNEVAVRVSRPEGVVAPVDVLIQNFHVLIANGSAQPAAPPTNAEPLPSACATCPCQREGRRGKRRNLCSISCRRCVTPTTRTRPRSTFGSRNPGRGRHTTYRPSSVTKTAAGNTVRERGQEKAVAGRRDSHRLEPACGSIVSPRKWGTDAVPRQGHSPAALSDDRGLWASGMGLSTTSWVARSSRLA